jgi:hypothetical protein
VFKDGTRLMTDKQKAQEKKIYQESSDMRPCIKKES